MAQVIIHESDDGLVVISPASHLNINEAAEYLVPVGTKYKIVEDNQLPDDPDFWGAWTIDCKVSIKKAKEIWKNKMRLVRDQKLKALDIEWMKAMENGEVKVASSIAAKKQMLRDVTEREDFRKLKTLKQIKSYWPEILH
jgi:hypothetical protein